MKENVQYGNTMIASLFPATLMFVLGGIYFPKISLLVTFIGSTVTWLMTALFLLTIFDIRKKEAGF